MCDNTIFEVSSSDHEYLEQGFLLGWDKTCRKHGPFRSETKAEVKP